MKAIQVFRRIGQSLNSSWGESIKRQNFQLDLIQKLYDKNGFELVKTCSACPEQYEVFKDGEQVGYFRLRHGVFTVDYPKCMGEEIYRNYPNGDGIFDDGERLAYLTKALRLIQNKIRNGNLDLS